MAGQVGAAYFLPILVVPLLLITHGPCFPDSSATPKGSVNAGEPVLGIRPLGHCEADIPPWVPIQKCSRCWATDIGPELCLR
jgi:hypothetical protein